MKTLQEKPGRKTGGVSVAVIESMVLRLYAWGDCMYCGSRHANDAMSCRVAHNNYKSAVTLVAGVRRAIEVSSSDVLERLASCR